MTPTTYLRILAVSLLSLFAAPLTSAVETSSYPPPQHVDRSGRPFTEQPDTDSSSSLLLLAIQANARPAALRSRPKAPEEPQDTSEVVLEPLPKPLAQVMFPKNATSSEGLGDHFQAAHIPPRIMDGWTDVCWGYYDVMGHFDNAFNCSKDSFIYCCGTCHYRFCCPDRTRRLEQDICKNYISPDWAKPQTDPMILPEELSPDPDYDPLKQQSHNTGFVIGGVIVFMVAVAVGIKVVFNKVQQEANQRDLNMPRALVDMLRHQSSPVQQDERNNSVALTVPDGQGTLGRPPKNLYGPGVPSKDNRLGNLQHNFIHSSGSSPKHTATIERTPRMNNAQLAAGGTLLSSKHNNTKSQPSFHHSLHNLAQLPPSYESATKPELNRYSSLKRLEKGLDEYSSGYCTTKRRPHTAQPALQSSQHHLHWGGDYTLSGRGTLPRHAVRPWIPPPPSGMPASPTPNPYPLDPPEPQYNPNYDTLSKPPRKVKSTDQLLNMGDVPGNTGTLSRLAKNQQHQYHKAMAASNKNSNMQTLTRKTQDRQERQERQERQDRMLMSPDHLEDRMGVGGMGVVDPYAHTGTGIVPTLPRQQKAQSQQNVCATPSLDRHHMIKMNSHPTSGREQERSTGMTSHVSSGVGWSGEMPGAGAGVVMGTGTLGGHSARRMAFAAKRQNTIEQLHFIPGGGGGGSAGSSGGSQGIRTGSKNEVTV
ncbi:protein shisa-7 [Cyprinodon tularosa]|uniref:Protein shisa-7-like n=1 Tax=Cyprinodon variegatus TaxID=28743 RepID=A0A3Q2DVT2_CYPVA|nr:PREDICTED: protein shisa-7-like [Cyprinodon variegatus]XP_015236652.1 PREDICTED: protein shisa-7-like [Cyprinodon variegatus]XP_015236653.1 PREDICTED: protein shisa-7-like [Cyprinodon variegatus]XP_015236654.1 PREDICTED: protein shisa-7-like [Cyprinodon variegatus]XP_038140273.1 protein shisa-7 [Cyprinodon tularosa]XP_038140274.1 protein shisa-7 [Cyprinodon tularosa]XP_038140275.1 protein shisa-7 [Cyprinodon tularosa]